MSAPLLQVRRLSCPRRGIATVSLDLGERSSVALLGPQGAGKTALLELLSGLATPIEGEVLLAGIDVGALRPDRRGIGLVAAAPYLLASLTIAGNVALAARQGGTDPGLLLARLGLRSAAHRRPSDLAPAMQLRAAIARALAASPRLLLLDDPARICAAATWPSLRRDLAALREELGFAMVIAGRRLDGLSPDSIVVMAGGAVVQAGTPRQLHARPASAVVARCLGEVNRLPGTLAAIHDDGFAEVRLAGGDTVEAMLADAGPVGAACDVLLRPEGVAVAAAAAAELGPGAVPARLDACEDRGDHVLLHLAIGDERILARRPAAPAARPGRMVAVAWQATQAWACRPEPQSPAARLAPAGARL